MIIPQYRLFTQVLLHPGGHYATSQALVLQAMGLMKWKGMGNRKWQRARNTWPTPCSKNCTWSSDVTPVHIFWPYSQAVLPEELFFHVAPDHIHQWHVGSNGPYHMALEFPAYRHVPFVKGQRSVSVDASKLDALHKGRSTGFRNQENVKRLTAWI